MKLWGGDTSGSWLVYPGTVMVTRARGQLAGPGRPEGTPILIVFPDELTDEEIDNGDAFWRACTIIPFRRRSGWVFAHRLARRVAAAKDGVRGVGFALKGLGHELGRINTGPVTFGRDVSGLQRLADEALGRSQLRVDVPLSADMEIGTQIARARRELAAADRTRAAAGRIDPQDTELDGVEARHRLLLVEACRVNDTLDARLAAAGVPADRRPMFAENVLALAMKARHYGGVDNEPAGFDIQSSAVAEMVQALPLTGEGSDRLAIDIGCAEALIAECTADGSVPSDPLTRAVGLRDLLAGRGWPLYFATAIALADGGVCPTRVFRSLEDLPVAASEPLRTPPA